MIYAIGDIHGDFAQLLEAHARIDADIARHKVPAFTIVHIGDLVDRRPDSRKVIDFMIDGHKRGAPWVTLKGNHDRLFQWFLKDPFRADPRLRPDYNWLHPRMGGRDTLRSYGVVVEDDHDLAEVADAARAAVPDAHYSFIRDLPVHYETGTHLFVHAGIRPGVPLAAQAEDDLVWIRHEFLDFTDPHPKTVVHGHTPVDDVTDYTNRINIDTGAAYGRPLSTIAIDADQVWLLTDTGRAPVPVSAP